MKNITIGVIGTTIILLIIIVFAFRSNSSGNIPSKYAISPTITTSFLPTSSPNSTTICNKDQLNGVMNPEGAAGNVYAKLEMTNIGSVPCKVILGNSITATFDANNIVLQNQLQGKQKSYILMPAEKVFSQIHYQNGPQCSTKITEKDITILYKTDQVSLNFITEDKKPTLKVPSCASFNEKTNIDIWPLTKNQISP